MAITVNFVHMVTTNAALPNAVNVHVVYTATPQDQLSVV